jgi:hypothetical protein
MTSVLHPIDEDIDGDFEDADVEPVAALDDVAASDDVTALDDAEGGDFDDDPEWDSATPAPVEKTDPGLTDQQRRMLTFERLWWKHAGSKEQAIREQFSLSATRYYQMLNQILDLPAAVEFDAMVVGRLRRLRATRARTRMAR